MILWQLGCAGHWVSNKHSYACIESKNVFIEDPVSNPTWNSKFLTSPTNSVSIFVAFIIIILLTDILAIIPVHNSY